MATMVKRVASKVLAEKLVKSGGGVVDVFSDGLKSVTFSSLMKTETIQI
jgi:hypothetical protein